MINSMSEIFFLNTIFIIENKSVYYYLHNSLFITFEAIIDVLLTAV
jgi:hypothetical protein